MSTYSIERKKERKKTLYEKVKLEDIVASVG
jgi:hypothetical protein